MSGQVPAKAKWVLFAGLMGLACAIYLSIYIKVSLYGP